MRCVPGYPLWLGSVADIRDLRGVLHAGIEAAVDLALNEPPATVTRELVYCRFPLVDGSGNPPWLLRAAVEAVARFIRADVPALVYRGAGMSRSPVIVALALALVSGHPPVGCLELATRDGPRDVSAGLWADTLAALGTA